MTFVDVAAPKRAIFSDLKTSSDESRARWLLKEPFEEMLNQRQDSGTVRRGVFTIAGWAEGAG